MPGQIFLFLIYTHIHIYTLLGIVGQSFGAAAGVQLKY